MWIVLRAVGYLFERVGYSFSPGNGVELFFGHLLLTAKVHYSLVDTLPVVHVFPLSPYLLELGFTLVHSHLVVEIPHRVLVVLSLVLRVAVVYVAGSASVLCYYLLSFLLGQLVLLLLFLFLQSLDHAVDGLVALFLVHLCQSLERVLQMNGVCVRHKLVENFGTSRQFLVVLTLFVEQSYSLAVAALRIVIALALPVNVAELEQQHTFLYAVTGRTAVSFLVC